MNKYKILKILFFIVGSFFAFLFVMMLPESKVFAHYIIFIMLFLVPAILLYKLGFWAYRKEKELNLKKYPNYYEDKKAKRLEKKKEKEKKRISKKEKKNLIKEENKLIKSNKNNKTPEEYESLFLEMVSKNNDRIARDSLAIIQNTKNAETFFSRYDLALKKMNRKNKNILVNSFDNLCEKFLYRFDNKISTKLMSLKTQKAKINNLYKFKSEIEPYLYRLSYENKNLYNDIISKYENASSKKFLEENHKNIIQTNNKDLTDNLLPVTVDVSVDKSNEDKLPKSFIQSIPNEVFNLLWFKNGPFKNLNQTEKSKQIISFSSVEEPSALDVYLPIKNGVDNNKIGYYPSYKALNEVQRYQYLNWLKDIREEIDISYVFIFYYGLERYLFTDKWKDACNMILKLQEFHNNNSFNAYSSDALLITAFKNKDMSLLNLIDKNKIQPAVYASIKGAISHSFDAEDIVSFARLVGWSNNRYIKSEYDLFLNELEKLIVDKYRSNVYSIDISEYKLIKKSVVLMLSNYSLDIADRKFEIPDILSLEKIKTDLYELLETTHNNVKTILREKRKN